MKARKYMFVEIPLLENHMGLNLYVKRIRISATCPICGGPRGKVLPNKVRSYDGSRFVYCDGWKNPCGHIDYYSEVRKEYFARLSKKRGNK